MLIYIYLSIHVTKGTVLCASPSRKTKIRDWAFNSVHAQT